MWRLSYVKVKAKHDEFAVTGLVGWLVGCKTCIPYTLYS